MTKSCMACGSTLDSVLLRGRFFDDVPNRVCEVVGRDLERRYMRECVLEARTVDGGFPLPPSSGSPTHAPNVEEGNRRQ